MYSLGFKHSLGSNALHPSDSWVERNAHHVAHLTFGPKVTLTLPFLYGKPRCR